MLRGMKQWRERLGRASQNYDGLWVIEHATERYRHRFYVSKEPLGLADHRV
jgi:hypothetical protein